MEKKRDTHIYRYQTRIEFELMTEEVKDEFLWRIGIKWLQIWKFRKKNSEENDLT